MVTKETCPRCKGRRYVQVRLPKGGADFRKCPECAGVGFKIGKQVAC